MQRKFPILIFSVLVALLGGWILFSDSSFGARVKLTATRAIAMVMGGKVGAMLDMAASTIVPVHFYGRVVDQYGQGVSGARVDLVISGGGGMASATGLNYTMTDSDGYFVVKGKGQNVSILNVRHEQLAEVYVSTIGGNKQNGGPSLRATDQYGKDFNWNSYEEKENPLIIDVWRVDKFEAVKRKNGAYHVPANGEATLFDNTLKVTCQRSEVSGSGEYGDWSISLIPIGGGIQETEELYLNQAPETGYQSEVTVMRRKGGPDYNHRIYPARHYYYHAKQGSFYASLEISFEPYGKKDNCILLTTMKYNQNGSGNLAIKPPD